MKFILRLLILTFIINQALPTIAVLIDSDLSITLSEDIDEDDVLNNFKDLKINFNTPDIFYTMFYCEKTKSKIFSKNNIIADSLPCKIFLSPPELV